MLPKNKALGLVLSEKNIFYVCPIVSPWELITPGLGPFLTILCCTITTHLGDLEVKVRDFEVLVLVFISLDLLNIPIDGSSS